MKYYKHLILIILTLIIIAGFFYFQPFDFLNDQNPSEDVSLVRDDFEFNVYYQRIGYYLDNEIPFKSDRVEYPALGLFYLTIPAMLTDTQADYDTALIIQNLVLLIILVILTNLLIKKLGGNRYLIWLLILPSVLYFSINRFDIFPAVLIQLAILLLLNKKFSWSFIILSVSFLTKGYAMVLFPVFFVYYLSVRDKQINNYIINKPFLLFSIPAVVIIVGMMIWAGFENALFPYIFQSTRNFAFGSIFGLFISANWQFFSEFFWDWYMYIGSKVLTFLQLTLPFLIYAGYKKFKGFVKTPQQLIYWSVLVLSLYIFLSPYYSPQWIIWIIPLLVLLPLNKREIGLIIIYDLLNFIFFPLVYGYLGYGNHIFDLVVVLRTVIFIFILLLIARKINRDQSSLLIK